MLHGKPGFAFGGLGPLSRKSLPLYLTQETTEMTVDMDAIRASNDDRAYVPNLATSDDRR